MYTITQGPVWAATSKDRYVTLLAHDITGRTPMMLAQLTVDYSDQISTMDFLNCTNAADDQAVLDFIQTFLNQNLNGGTLVIQNPWVDHLLTKMQDTRLTWSFSGLLVARTGTSRATFDTTLIRTMNLSMVSNATTVTLTLTK